MKNELILVLDFGGQYNQLIARRVRECNVYCEIVRHDIKKEEILKMAPRGIIFTGGPASVLDEDAPICDSEILNLNIPILGICYGMQLIAKMSGGAVDKSNEREYGKTNITYDNQNNLFKNIEQNSTCFMSHTFYVKTLPVGFKNIAKTVNCEISAMENVDKNIYAVQFHPEVIHTPCGTKIINNFLYNICNVTGDWKMSNYKDEAVKMIREKVGDKKVFCALSGGVDSSVVAVLLHKAVGSNLTCVFVDHGLLRKGEANSVQQIFKNQFNINLITVNAKERFLKRLKGIIDPEKKRKIIGEEFIRVFEDEKKKIGTVDFLAQGTIYPDVIESGQGNAAVIKSHHNVGGLPESFDFIDIIEPLRNLFKDEVRTLGRELEIPSLILDRQPFPGPGLAIRIIGEINDIKLDILRESEDIFNQEILKADLQNTLNQYFAVLTNIKSVGVMGDERTYDYTIALRAVTTPDFMTAQWAKIPFEVLENVSNRIVNEVKYVNRVVYDITSKPPATIEWE